MDYSFLTTRHFICFSCATGHWFLMGYFLLARDGLCVCEYASPCYCAFLSTIFESHDLTMSTIVLPDLAFKTNQNAIIYSANLWRASQFGVWKSIYEHVAFVPLCLLQLSRCACVCLWSVWLVSHVVCVICVRECVCVCVCVCVFVCLK